MTYLNTDIKVKAKAYTFKLSSYVDNLPADMYKKLVVMIDSIQSAATLITAKEQLKIYLFRISSYADIRFHEVYRDLAGIFDEANVVIPDIENTVLYDKFLTNVATPMPASRSSEPGPGKLVKRADTGGHVAIINNILMGDTAAVTGTYTDPAYQWTENDDTALARGDYPILYFVVQNRYTSGSSGIGCGAAPDATPSASDDHREIIFLGGNVYMGMDATPIDSYDDYEIFKVYALAIVIRAVGFSTFIRGGLFSSWTNVSNLLDTNDVDIYPQITNIKNSDVVRAFTKNATGILRAETFPLIKSSAPATGATFTGSATGWVHAYFDIAAGGSAGDKMEIRYRRADATNYMFMRLVWASSSTYTFETGHVIAGAETVQGVPVASALSAGTTRCIIAKVVGNLHHYFTYRTGATSMIKRYNDISDSSGAANTGVEIVYVGGFSNIKLEMFSRTSASYVDLQAFTDLNFLMMGDSKTSNNQVQGYLADFYSRNYPTVLAKSTPAAFAVGGATVASRKASVDADIAAAVGVPNHIFINLGVNDVSDVPTAGFEATWKANYLYILDALHTAWPSAKIYVANIWSSVPNQTYLATLNTWIDYVRTSRAWSYQGIDERIVLEGGDNGATMTSDGTHPSVPLGERATAEAWVQAMVV